MAQVTKFNQCTVATMVRGSAPYGLIENGEIIVEHERITWVGPSNQAPDEYSSVPPTSLGGRLVTPALIDCHTHVVFGGDRALEFEQRLQGVSYETISKQGGGILSTVKATREASFNDLLDAALGRVDRLMAEGIGVVEIKSGYGLTIEHEIRMLRVAREIGRVRDIVVKTSWLAAHALPPEYKDRPDAYIDDIAIEGLRQAHAEGLVDAVDGFCETIGFSPAQIDRLFKVAGQLGLPVKLHAEQLSDQQGAVLAARHGGLSADHLEYLAPSDVPKLPAAGTVAVLLPGAFYTLRETKLPPIDQLRQHGAEIAIATDCNPGSSPMPSLLMAMNMACTLFSMTPEEALIGTTRAGASALGLSGEYGVIAPGAVAHLAVWDVAHPAELSYWIGGSPLHQTILQGHPS